MDSTSSAPNGEMGEAKAALELGKRILSLQSEERTTLTSPEDVANLLLTEMGFLEQEEFRVAILNTKNQVLAVSKVYRGTVNTSVVRVSEVFREAVRQNMLR